MQAEFASPAGELSAEEELRIMELEFSILEKRRQLAQRVKEPPLKPVPEEPDASWAAVEHGKVEHLS